MFEIGSEILIVYDLQIKGYFFSFKVFVYFGTKGKSNKYLNTVHYAMLVKIIKIKFICPIYK